LLAPNKRVCPSQIGEFAVAVGAAGIGLTVAFTIPAGLTQPREEVVVTEYAPVARVVATVIVGFWLGDEKLFGPVQLNETPVPVAPKFKFCPSHIGVLTVPLGAAGVGLTTNVMVAAALPQPEALTNTL
jgi:hypothetical protein